MNSAQLDWLDFNGDKGRFPLPRQEAVVLPPPKDSIVDAAQRLNCRFLESFFFRASLEEGYGVASEIKARELMVIYTDPSRGYKKLPQFVRDFALKVCNGEYSPEKGIG